MRDLLAGAQRPLLRDLAGRRTLLAFDFDGTLAPLVAARGRARLRATTARLLAEVARGWPCAVISGRAREDVRRRLGPAPLLAVVGNHGAETRPPLPGAPAWRRRVRAWRPSLRRSLRALPGAELEDKGLSITVHLRVDRPAEARRRVERVARALPGAVPLSGHRVLNLLARGAPGKGQALRTLVRAGGFERVLFVGDDDTDEEAFGSDVGAPLLAVRVGRRRSSAARFFLARQADVDRLLRRLRRARRQAGG